MSRDEDVGTGHVDRVPRGRQDAMTHPTVYRANLECMRPRDIPRVDLVAKSRKGQNDWIGCKDGHAPVFGIEDGARGNHAQVLGLVVPRPRFFAGPSASRRLAAIARTAACSAGASAACTGASTDRLAIRGP